MRLVLQMIVILAGLLVTKQSFAWEPNEVLADAALETRAREISAQLRCLVCQNQSIDDSDADLAKDLRLLVRERLTAGDSDKEVFDSLVARYGNFILLKPPLVLNTLLLWGLPVLILVLGGFIILRSGEKRTERSQANDLTDAEKAKLSQIIDKQ